MLPVTVFQCENFFCSCCVCHTSCESKSSGLCNRAPWVFFFLLLLLLPNVMQSTTAVATLGDFSCHRRQTKPLFWSLEMLFWAHAPPMLSQIWPKEAARLFTDPACCRKISPVWGNRRAHEATRGAMTDMNGWWVGGGEDSLFWNSEIGWAEIPRQVRFAHAIYTSMMPI